MRYHKWKRVPGMSRRFWVCEICGGHTEIREGLPSPFEKVSPTMNIWLTCEEMQAWRIHAS
jgi:hypothetical protein